MESEACGVACRHRDSVVGCWRLAGKQTGVTDLGILGSLELKGILGCGAARLAYKGRLGREIDCSLSAVGKVLSFIIGIGSSIAQADGRSGANTLETARKVKDTHRVTVDILPELDIHLCVKAAEVKGNVLAVIGLGSWKFCPIATGPIAICAPTSAITVNIPKRFIGKSTQTEQSTCQDKKGIQYLL